MKTNEELDDAARRLLNIYHREMPGEAADMRKLLRSIELDAWREALELVEKLPRSHYGEIGSQQLIGEMNRLIQQLQLK